MTDAADVLTNVCTAFYSRFTGAAGADLYAALGGRLFEDEAPEGTPYPYAVYRIVSAPKDKTFSEEYTDLLIQLSIFSSSKSSAEIKAIYYHAHALYDEQPLTITGSTLVWMRETGLTPLVEDHTTPDGTVTVKHYAMDIEIRTSLD